MSKAIIQFNDYVSLAVMLLMFVALVAGQADARANAAGDTGFVTPVVIEDDRIHIDFDGHLGDAELKLSIAVATDLSHFRGEDE